MNDSLTELDKIKLDVDELRVLIERINDKLDTIMKCKTFVKRKPDLRIGEVREIFFSEKTAEELAIQFNRSVHTINLIRRGASYQRWTKPYRVMKQKQLNGGKAV